MGLDSPAEGPEREEEAENREVRIMGTTQTVRPWGVTRAVPVTRALECGYTGVSLDEDTQIATYIDRMGHPVEATGGQHDGTMRETIRSNPTGGGDGQNPTPRDDVNVTTYVPD